MARVVPKPGGPPYLLIVFVFLFLISTTLAVLFYMQSEKEKKQTVAAQDNLKPVATSEELKNPSHEKIKVAFREQAGRGGKSPSTVVGYGDDLIRNLVEQITGTEGNPESALAMAKANFKDVEAGFKKATKTAFPRTGLANQIVFLNNKLIETIEDLNGARGAVLVKNEEVASKETQLQKLIDDHKETVKTLTGKQQQLERRAEDREKQHQALIGQNKATYDETIAERDRTVATITQKTEQDRLEIQKLKERIAEFDKLVNELRGAKGNLGAAPRPDGKVLRVEGDICYIDIGSEDKLLPGTPFAVYPQSGIPKDKEKDEDYKGKADLVVARVTQDVAECRIVRRTPGDPVIMGDLVANAAFDRTLTYTFVVHGEFDLYGKSRPSVRGNEEVRTLIKRFGGNVAEKITVQTDFLVVGAVPVDPPSPSEDDEPNKIKVYRELKEKRDQYYESIALARSLGVRILNANRFLALVGFTPEKEE